MSTIKTVAVIGLGIIGLGLLAGSGKPATDPATGKPDWAATANAGASKAGEAAGKGIDRTANGLGEGVGSAIDSSNALKAGGAGALGYGAWQLRQRSSPATVPPTTPATALVRLPQRLRTTTW